MVARVGSQRPSTWFVAGMVATTLIALLDAARQDSVLITGVVAGPLLAAIGATIVEVGLVGAYAIALSLLLGAFNDSFLTGNHFLRVAVVVLASVTAVVVTRRRERVDAELERARPQAADAQHLRLALDASSMGTWRWETSRDEVEWDEALEALFGLPAGSFDRTFRTYESMLHPEDRPRVLAAVREGMARDVPWRFDHRVVWPDGSIHWLEGRGEPVHDASGKIVGAAGVTINVDQRHALLDAERRARESAESTSKLLQDLAQITVALAGAITVAEVGDVIVSRAVESLHAKSGYFATVDEQTQELVARSQSGYPDWVVRRYQRVVLDDAVPGCDVIRTGQPLYIESRERRLAEYPQYTDDPTHEAFVVVPLPDVQGARAVLAFGFSEPRRFTPEDRAFLGAVIEACGQALQRATAYEAEQAARGRLRVLLDGSEQLNALDDADLVADTIAQLAATRIGTWATLVRVLPGGGLERVATAHRDPDLHHLVDEVVDKMGEGREVNRVIATGQPIVLHRLTPRARGRLSGDDVLWAKLQLIGAASCLLVPISIGGRNLAVLTIGSADPGQLRDQDVELAIDLGRRARARSNARVCGRPAASNSKPNIASSSSCSAPSSPISSRTLRVSTSPPRTGPPNATSTSAATGTTGSSHPTAPS